MAKEPTDLTRPAKQELFLMHIAEFFLDGLFLMLAIGVAHAEVHRVPTFGYWQCCFFAWVLQGIAMTGNLAVLAKVRRIGELVVSRG